MTESFTSHTRQIENYIRIITCIVKNASCIVRTGYSPSSKLSCYTLTTARFANTQQRALGKISTNSSFMQAVCADTCSYVYYKWLHKQAIGPEITNHSSHLWLKRVDPLSLVTQNCVTENSFFAPGRESKWPIGHLHSQLPLPSLSATQINL